MDFTTQWRFEAVRLAAMEQLDIHGELNMDALFVRAKEIYSKGHEHKIKNWNSIWEGEGSELAFKPGKAPKQPEPVKEVEVTKEGKKQCPSCGEFIPAGWNKHSFKEDGSKCGYQF